MADLLSIGRFARLTGLSVGALRHYDEVGLLRPARTDPDTGYRFYREDQLPQARAVQRLRALDLSLDEIRDVLADGDVAALRQHARRVQARIWRLQRVQYRLNALIDGTEDLMAEPKTGIDVDHRQLGVDLFNYTWTLLEKDDRTKAEDDEMLNSTHASAYHWSRATDAPENQARSQWQISRVNAVLGRGDAAVYHAQRCLDLCVENGIGDWDLASAYEALARAHLVAGNDAEYRRNLELGQTALAAIPDPEDREIIGKDLAELRRASPRAAGTAPRRRTARSRARLSALRAITSCATRWMSSAVTASSPSSTSVGSVARALEHLAAKPEHDRPVRALELEDEAPLREVARLLQLVGGHRLVRDPPELGRRSSRPPRRCG